MIHIPLDLVVAHGSVLILSAAVGWLVSRDAKSKTSRRPEMLGCLAAGALLLHALYLGDNPILTRALPVADCLAWLDLRPIAVAVLAAVAWARFPKPDWQRYLFVSVLAVVGMWRVAEPYLGRPPHSGPSRVHDGIFLQSNLSACAPAAAATALRWVGIDASEAEMTDLCLTTEEGTGLLGLYRGLMIKCRGSPYRIKALGGSAHDLMQQAFPAIIMIGQPGAGDWLGIGNRHAVVLLGFEPDGRAQIGDPMSGRQTFLPSELEREYQHAGFGIVAP